jgi:hypothetical protein
MDRKITTTTGTTFIDVNPNWQRLFQFAEGIVRKEIDVNKGQAFVIEMLEYGETAIHGKGGE